MKSKMEICGLSINVSINTTNVSGKAVKKRALNFVDSTGRKLKQTYVREDPSTKELVIVPKGDGRMKGIANKAGVASRIYTQEEIKGLRERAAMRCREIAAARTAWVPLDHEANSLRIEGFVAVKMVNLARVKQVYYLAPEETGQDEGKNYGLVHQALLESGQAGFGMHLISSTSMGRYPAVVMAVDGGLLLYKMYFDDQFKHPKLGWAGVINEFDGDEDDILALKNTINEMHEAVLPSWVDVETEEFNRTLDESGVETMGPVVRTDGSLRDRIRAAAEQRRAMMARAKDAEGSAEE